MVAINPQTIEGNWRSGKALDWHMIESVHVGQDQFGHDKFENQRSPLGELVFRLKYRSDNAAAAPIIETAARFLRPHTGKIDIIVPAPASRARTMQPVIFLANGIGEALSIPVLDCVQKTRAVPQQLKNVNNPEERSRLLSGLHTVDPNRTRGKRILLFDDLFDSGATMNAITNVLMEIGEAQTVHALTLTCTRRSR